MAPALQFWSGADHPAAPSCGCPWDLLSGARVAAAGQGARPVRAWGAWESEGPSGEGRGFRGPGASFVSEARWGRGPTHPGSAESVHHLTGLLQFVFNADLVVFVDVCLINSIRFVFSFCD